MGDGIMALFGAPLAHEDHAVRACYAALRMQEAVKQYAEEVRRTEGLAIQIRVGLNSGEVVVRSIGSDLRMDYTAVGPDDPPRRAHGAAGAARLDPAGARHAPAGRGLRAGEGARADAGEGAGRARRGVRATRRGDGALAAPGGRGAGPDASSSGRDAELETLRRTLEQAGSGHGQIVALVGEPGVGKSRLVWEFSHSHRTQGWLVLESGSVSYGKATSLPAGDRPAQELLRHRGPRRRAAHPREADRASCSRSIRRSQPTLPAFLALLDVPVDDAAVAGARPAAAPPAHARRLKRLLLRESQEQPLLLVFEDLHWIDAETQALLDSLVESLPTARLLLLVNYRPEYEHAWHRKTYYQQLRLDPLPPESAEELLAALLGDDAELQPLKRAADRAHGGQPVLPRRERPHAGGDAACWPASAARYRLAKPFESTQVPATVQAVLAARIDRLAPEDKRLLQSAAVIGKDVPYPLLQAIAELPEDALRQGLARLQAAEFLYETSLFPDLEYTFKHALTHEVAYGSLLQERRRALHAPDRGGHRDAVPRPPGRAGRAARAPRAAGRGVGQGRGLPPAGGREGGGALGAPRGGGVLRAGAGRRSDTCPRAARRASRPSTSGSTCATRSCPLGESERMLDVPARGRDRSPRRSATSAGWGVSPSTMAIYFW